MAKSEEKSMSIEVDQTAKGIRLSRAIESVIKMATSNAKSGIDVFDFNLDKYKGMSDSIITRVFARTLGTVITSVSDVNDTNIRFYIVTVNR